MSLDFHLVDSGWDKVLNDALKLNHPRLRIISPFIKRRVAKRILKMGKPKDIQVITRFNLLDFFNGVSDTAALRLLLEHGAQVRGVRNLHSKVYLFGDSRAIVTSANLTESALGRNQEFGFVADETGIISRCSDYFANLWSRAGANLSFEKLDAWEKKVTDRLAKGSRPSGVTGLGDEGVDVGESVPPVDLPPWAAEAPQAFVKFFGISSSRAEHNLTIFDEVKRSGCHWACTYPKGKRPRQVEDGALIFMARLVEGPDIIIFGRAVAMAHVPGRDDATEDDIKLRDFKSTWPHYIRVHHPEFVTGTMANGVSLSELMDELQANAFASTQRNAAQGEGNTNPRMAYMQQPAVRLSPQGLEWLNTRLEEAFARHGRIAGDELANLDWPDLSLSPVS